ncbi:AF4/FMR2 family member 1-like [Athene noctua]|uniref:AF4/FMR2 family member 1-like n=1 Tax=Athene noctua TaxID=126797 RepID=UPI003EC03859
MTDQLPSGDSISALNTETFGFTATKSLSLERQLCANNALWPQTPTETRETPVLVSQVTPVLVSQATPVLVSQVTPVLVSQATPVLVSQVTPVLVSQATPVLVSQVMTGFSSLSMPNVQKGCGRILQDDLQLRNSKESGDDQVAEKPPPSLAPPKYSTLQSQPRSVASACSIRTESGSSSDSESSSDSDSTSSGSEAKDPPRASAPEPNPPTSNKWHLSNWLTKLKPPAAPTETPSKTAPGDVCEESKEQGQGLSSNSSHQCTEPREPQHKSSDQAAMAPQDAHVLGKDNCQKSPVHAQEPSPRPIVGVKRPSKAPMYEGPKKGLKMESDPGALEGRDQSARDKTKVNPKGKPDARKWDLERKTRDTPEKSLQKWKRAAEIDGKKKKSEKEPKSSESSTDKDSSKLKASKASPETQKKGVLLPLPLSSMSPASPAPKSTKMAKKRRRSESGELLAGDNSARNKSSHEDPLLAKHRKEEGNHADLSKGIEGSAGDVTNPSQVMPFPDGTSKPRQPPIKFENQHPVEYYIEEARRLKHKADAMTDKTGRAFQYLDAALSFIEYGIALESDTTAPKSASSVFSGTIDLLKFIMKLKSFTDSSASSHDNIFAVLCMRCQSILHMAMCHYNKDTAIRYSRVLNDHFKSSSRLTQAPSPCVPRSTGVPSYPSAMPRPASSVSSQPGLNASNCSGNSCGSSFSVPYNIPNIMSSYIDTTSYVIYAYDFWEKADALAGKNTEFFAELSAVTGTLALNSSVRELVHYARQGLQCLRLVTATP